VVVANVAAQQHVGKLFEDATQTAAMRRLLVGTKQILERRHALRKQLVHVPLDDREILGMAGLDQD
jgi:GDP-D-mannose dehydratase